MSGFGSGYPAGGLFGSAHMPSYTTSASTVTYYNTPTTTTTTGGNAWYQLTLQQAQYQSIQNAQLMYAAAARVQPAQYTPLPLQNFQGYPSGPPPQGAPQPNPQAIPNPHSAQSSPLRANRFLAASDLLEDFIAYVGPHGVSKAEFRDLPIELFIQWLVLEAAKQDGEDIAELPDPAQHPALTYQPARGMTDDDLGLGQDLNVVQLRRKKCRSTG